MATIFRDPRNTTAGSGGKILRGRRVAAVTSPYARSPLHPNSSPPPPESPNWLYGVVVPATRMIVNGAGKIVSTVFGSQDSSYSSESDAASSSEDDGNDDDDDVSEESDSLKQNGTTSNANKYVEREAHKVVQKSDAKLEIERLLMQETFSRDECNRLIKIIQSRVVECHTSKDGGDGGESELPDRTIASSTAVPGALQTRQSYSYLGNGFDSLSPSPLSYRPAIMEAKKWLEEKKSESCSRLDSGHWNFTSRPFMLPNVTEGEVGSPVIMAKTYMQARPAWSSPSSSHVGFRAPAPIGMHLVKEEAPYTTASHSLSSSKFLKRSSFADDSWNILAESRIVRSKTEEDNLPPNSSMHIESSTPELEQNGSHTTSRDGKQDGELGVLHDSNSLPATRSINSSTDLPEKVMANGALTVHGELVNENTSSVPAIIVSNQNQDFEDARATEAEGCTNFVTNESLVPDSISLQEDGPPDHLAEMVKSELNVTPADDIKPAVQSEVDLTGIDESREVRMQQDSQLGETVLVKNSEMNEFSGWLEMESIDDSRPSTRNHPSQKDVNGSRDRVTANGFPSLASSLPVGLNVESGVRPAEEGSSDSKLGTSIPAEEENCELLSEASIEIPINNEIADSESQSSSSKHSKDLLQIESHQSSRKSRVEKQQQQQQRGKKVGRYSRRIGRGGRGK